MNGPAIHARVEQAKCKEGHIQKASRGVFKSTQVISGLGKATRYRVSSNRGLPRIEAGLV